MGRKSERQRQGGRRKGGKIRDPEKAGRGGKHDGGARERRKLDRTKQAEERERGEVDGDAYADGARNQREKKKENASREEQSQTGRNRGETEPNEMGSSG
jgi:hypothetical protein